MIFSLVLFSYCKYNKKIIFECDKETFLAHPMERERGNAENIRVTNRINIL